MTTLPFNQISRSNLFGAYLVAETCSVYASSLSRSLKLVSVSVVDRVTHRSVPAGHIGDLQAVVNWHGFIATIAISIVLFALALSALSMAANRTGQLTTYDPIDELTPEDPNVQIDSAVANA